MSSDPSRRLSYILRHAPDSVGLQLDEAGWVNGAPSTVYDRDNDGRWSIYGGYEGDEPVPTKKMLVI